MLDVTRRLAAFAAGLRHDELPPDVAARTRALVLDQAGIALRARAQAEIAQPAARALEALGLGAGTATVIGDPDGYAPAGAAFFNGMLGHCLDFDDTHARGSIHPSAPIVWAAMAAAESVGADGRDVLAGITAGYEIQIRLSIALGPSDHYDRGFHPTATCGVFGAAAASARVLGLDEAGCANALGLAGSQAAGSMQFLGDGAWNKPYHTGYAAMGGLVAATFAARGFRGAAQAVEGRSGFLRSYAPRPRPEAAGEALGQRWETLNIAVKPYPSCRYGHAAMDALIALRSEHPFADDEIEDVEIGLPHTGWKIIGEPLAEKQAPRNYVDGQFSMPFVAAVALREGGMTWDSYARHLGDERTLALTRRVRCVVDPQAEAEYPNYMAGVARVRLRDGRTLEKLVVAARGEPENFLTDEELKAKFDALAAPCLPEARREALASALLGLDGVADVRRALALARPEPARVDLRAAGSGD